MPEQYEQRADQQILRAYGAEVILTAAQADMVLERLPHATYLLNVDECFFRPQSIQQFCQP